MNVILLGLAKIDSIDENGINTDLMREFIKNGHQVTIYCGTKSDSGEPYHKSSETRADIYNVNVGRVQKVNPIIKGINFLSLDSKFLNAIKKTYKQDTLDLVIYLTPPITLTKTIGYLKKKYKCHTYLLLKDIFPQNSVDLGMLSKGGVKGIIYKYFRKIEKDLYKLPDYIGCMSQANVDYTLLNNSFINKENIEVNPNCIDVSRLEERKVSKKDIRNKYSIPVDKKVFVYGGNLGKPQDIPFVLKCIEAAEPIDDVYFVIVGDGTDYRLVNDYVTNKKPQNLTLIQRLSTNDYLDLISSCDVALIFLDHRFTIPNYPSRLLDYMRAGLPIYACTDSNTDIGKTITGGGFGWWSESNDVDTFVSNVQMISKTTIENVRELEHNYLINHFSSEKAYETIMKHFK